MCAALAQLTDILEGRNKTLSAISEEADEQPPDEKLDSPTPPEQDDETFGARVRQAFRELNWRVPLTDCGNNLESKLLRKLVSLPLWRCFERACHDQPDVMLARMFDKAVRVLLPPQRLHIYRFHLRPDPNVIFVRILRHTMHLRPTSPAQRSVLTVWEADLRQEECVLERYLHARP